MSHENYRIREKCQRCLSSLTEATGVNGTVSSSFQVMTSGRVVLLFASKNMSTLDTPKRLPLRGQVGIKLADTTKSRVCKQHHYKIALERLGQVFHGGGDGCACLHVCIRKKKKEKMEYATAVQTRTDGRGGAVSWGKEEGKSCQQQDMLAASSLFD